MPNVVSQRPQSFGVPKRPRQFDETQPDYETPEEYNSWGKGGENFANNQINAQLEEQGGLTGGDDDSSTEGGGYGKKRKGENSRGQMNLTGKQGSSILTS